MNGDRFLAPYHLIWEGINNGLSEFCKKDEHVFLDELIQVVADPERPSRLIPRITYDGAHFNYEGYEMLGKAMAGELKDVLKKDDTVLMYGDSITAGFPYHEPVLSPGLGDPKHSYGFWVEDILKVDVVNQGISGDTSGGILQRFIDDEKKGDVVILQGGANDAMSYMLVKPPDWTIQMILNNFKEMAWVAKRRGIEPILMPLLPFDPEW